MHNSTYGAYQLVYFNCPGVFVSFLMLFFLLLPWPALLCWYRTASNLLQSCPHRASNQLMCLLGFPSPVAILPMMSMKNRRHQQNIWRTISEINQRPPQASATRSALFSTNTKNGQTLDEINIPRQHTISLPPLKGRKLLIYVKCVCFLSGILEIMKVIRP